MILPALPDYEEVQARLRLVFPDGTAQRRYLTRELAASTVFVALYIGAIEGSGVLLAPKHVYRMSDEQAERTDAEARSAYARNIMKPGAAAFGVPWYADTTREPIRDETLREGLEMVGAAIEDKSLPTTSSKPRYALTPAFAALFDPAVAGEALEAAIAAWQVAHLSKGALTRIQLLRLGADTDVNDVTVTFPGGETRRMKPGASSIITKAVVEVFAPTFLVKPVVLFLSESGRKVYSRDDALAKAIGLIIEADKNLPDIVLIDLGQDDPLLVFVEAVATDGPISQRRKDALGAVSGKAGFSEYRVAYVTAYLDRSQASFKKTVDSLAWGTYAWFVSEPDKLMALSADRKAFQCPMSV